MPSRESLEKPLCKQRLMRESGHISEDQDADRNKNSKGQGHEVSVGNEDTAGNWARGLVCLTPPKSLSTFYPHAKTSSEVNLKMAD